jgi:hypothetical protein
MKLTIHTEGTRQECVQQLKEVADALAHGATPSQATKTLEEVKAGSPQAGSGATLSAPPSAQTTKSEAAPKKRGRPPKSTSAKLEASGKPKDAGKEKPAKEDEKFEIEDSDLAEDENEVLEDELDEEEESDEDGELDEDEDEEKEDDDLEEVNFASNAEEENESTLEDVITALQKYSKKHSRDKAAKVLAKFRVRSVRDLPKQKFGEIIGMLK